MAHRRISPASADETLIEGPVRTCVGCRQRAAKRELLRVTAGSVDGRPAVLPDPSGTAPGRGAHLHVTQECYDLAVRRKAFGRALRASTALSVAPVEHYLGSQHHHDRPSIDPQSTQNRSNSS